MRTHVRLWGLVSVLALAVVACGSLVEPLPQNQAAPGQPLPGGVPTTGTTDPNGAPIAGPTTGVGPQVPTNPNEPIPGVPVDPSCRATKASDTGVTKDRIKLGLIASLTGPLPGQFDSAVEAVDSFFKDLNSRGGICGRLIDLTIKDDNGDGGRNLTIAEQMAEDGVFAFVGSHSAPDDSGIPKVSKREGIPDIGFPLTWERAESPLTYGVPGIVRRETIGEGASGSMYLNRVNDIEQVAIFWLRESEVSILQAWAFEAAMIKSSGGKIRICHEQSSGVLDNNYTNYVVSMKGKCDAGVTAVYSTMENNANIKLATAMRDQNFKPKVFAPTFSSYLPSFLRPATEGAYIAMPQIPFERLSTPQDTWTPGTYELQRYLAALKRFYPNHKPPGSFGAPAWGSALLFATVAAKCGDDLTRACVLNELDTMGEFAANGLLTPTRPSDHRIYTKDLIVQVRNGRFVEIRPNDKSGPKIAPDFWDASEIFNWQKYYCANKEKFPNTSEKDPYITAC